MDPFLTLSAADRAVAFQQAEAILRLPAASIEKDFWVCFTLRALFSLPDWQDHLTFKGGTSLSKAWDLIQRFSEDIDLVIDRPFLGIEGDAAPENAPSRKQRLKRVEDVKIRARAAIEERLLPTLEQQLASVIPPGPDWQVAVDPDDPDQQTLLFHYPGVLQPKEASLSPYVRPVVRVELGARSDTEPLERCEIEPDIARVFPEPLRDGHGYDGLTPAGLRLRPDPGFMSDWRADYQKMRESMFYGLSPDFDEVLREVGRFEDGLPGR